MQKSSTKPLKKGEGHLRRQSSLDSIKAKNCYRDLGYGLVGNIYEELENIFD